MAQENLYKGCDKAALLSLHDALNILKGKWEVPVIGLLLEQKRRFNEMKKSLHGITPRQLSMVLNNLEMNGIVLRKPNQFSPGDFCEYELTPSGHRLENLIFEIVEWGRQHRRIYFSRNQ